MSVRSPSKIEAAVFAVVVLAAPDAVAQLRLRGDALADTQAPVGLLVLHGEDRSSRWLDAETVSWLGSKNENATGDVLTLSVRARHPESGSEARVGRMVVMMGGLRPVHIDGAKVLGRAGGTSVEAFSGVPVVSSFGWKQFDWTAGGRVAETFGSIATLGGSYAVRKRGAEMDDEEAALDFSATPARWLTAAGRASYDLTTRGLADSLASLSAQNAELRGELFVNYRSPARLISKTSLFSVLGDVPATTTGVTGRWQAAPRLSLVASGSVQARAGDTGGQGFGRAVLALDDASAGELGLEARRVDFAGGRWLGLRTTATLPIRETWRASTELELVRPDDPGTRRPLWPWALVALAWQAHRNWEIAGALEAAQGPDRAWIAALARASFAFEAAR